MKLYLHLLHAASALVLSGGLNAQNIRATIHAVPAGVELRFHTISDRYYDILASTDLAAWEPVESAIPGNAAEVLRYYPTDGVPARFFQVLSFTVPAGFARIPAGSFIMGNSVAGDDMPDAPPHEVALSAFYMARNLVTKADWDAVRTWASGNGYNDLAAGSGKAGNHPVQMVSWWDCIKYCNARSQKEGLTPAYTVNGAVMKTGTSVPSVNWSANGYRLPTEAEWEKSARGGLSGRRFPWSNTISHTQANYDASGGESYDLSVVKDYHPSYATGVLPYTSPVESFAANGYGLNDMAGNVWQWCWDWRGDYDTESPTDPRGVNSGAFRVIRGGSWNDIAFSCRTAHRNAAIPMNTSNTFGFRVVRSSMY
jgi:formylglycine-generating enzyme